MSFISELSNPQFQTNVVISMAGQTYSRFQIDSGLIIPIENIIVSTANLPALTVDIRNVRTALPSNTFELLDYNSIISNRMGSSETRLLNEEVIIYIGFVTGSYPWTEYKEFARGNINSINKKENAYVFSSRASIDYLQKTIFSKFDSLSQPLTDVGTSELFLYDVSMFPDSGTVKVGNEFISYTGRDTTLDRLTGLTRGNLSSVPEEYEADENVFRVDLIEGNPLTLLLQIMISGGGGGIYDVLPDGLGIDPLKINVAEIESIRNQFFPTDIYRFYLYETGEALSFLETEILQATNTRFISEEGLIGIAILDQVIIGEPTPTIDEDSSSGFPQWTTNSDKVVNQIIMQYNYSPGLNKFTKTETFDDLPSQEAFGKVTTLIYKSKGIQADLDGAGIVSNRATRLLARLSTPQTEIKVKAFFSNADLQVGDKITFEHRYLPGATGGLGIRDQMEIMSKGLNLNDGTLSLSLQYTSFISVRLAVISPSPLIIDVLSDSEFEVENYGIGYEVGYNIRINNEQRAILTVNGNIITVDSDFSFPLTVGMRLKFVDYNNATDEQKQKYIFIGITGGNFPDGKKPYLISP